MVVVVALLLLLLVMVMLLLLWCVVVVFMLLLLCGGVVGGIVVDGVVCSAPNRTDSRKAHPKIRATAQGDEQRALRTRVCVNTQLACSERKRLSRRACTFSQSCSSLL